MSWSTIRTAILERFQAQSPVPAERQALDSFNLPFTPPAIDAGTPANSIWIRPTIVPFRGTSKPFGLAQNAHNWREGQIVLQIFYPSGFGEGPFLDSVVVAAVQIFHRLYLGDALRCKDSEDPEPVDSDDPKWSQINVVTPYVVIEVL
ncbi:MAG: hypothetical protein ABI639_17620 [Thermoanaerobaculia bacterium]